MNKILYVHKDESIAYLIDRIESYKGVNVYLNIDANLDLFSEATNLKLLKREADILGKNLIIVSDDSDVLTFAENSGFEVMGTDELKDEAPSESGAKSFLDAAKGSMISDIKQPNFLNKNQQNGNMADRVDSSDSSDLFYDKKDEKAESFFEKSISAKKEAQEAPQVFNKKRNDNLDKGIDFKFNVLKDKRVLAGVLLVLFVFIVSSIFIFKPKASLDIAVKKETINFTFPVTADASLSEVDLENSIIPGQVVKLTKEVSGTFEATGKSSGATRASGKITIYNDFGKDPQVLIAKTRFQTEDGKIYRIQERVVVPGAKVENGKVVEPGTLEVEVVADQPGSDYNIGPSFFTIPGFEGTPRFKGFYAKSSSNITGGSLGETKVIAQKDLDSARETLLKMLKDSEDEFLNESIPGNFTILKNAVDLQTEFSAPKVGSASDSFDAVLKASYNVFTFSEDDVKNISENILTSKIREDKKTYPDTKVLSYDEGIFNLDESKFTFSVTVSEVVGGKIDEIALKKALAGKGKEEIAKVLRANEAIESAEITLWPRWASEAPSDINRIEIIISE